MQASLNAFQNDNATEVQITPQVRDRLFAPGEYALHAIAAALRPFYLQFAPSHDGVLITGDRTAQKLAANIVTDIAQSTTPLARLDAEQVARAIAQALEYALKHDLAFRLPGLNVAIRPLSLAQVKFMEELLNDPHELIFGIGPTGTGKTHLAIAAGLNLLAEERVKSLIMTRPHVLSEGETMTAALRAETKADTQLTPFYDELHSLIGHEEIQRLTELGKLEIVPLGLLRGRTFNDAYIIVDEAQNMSVSKMRMVLTRLGNNSRMIVTGDPTHVHMLDGGPSGLAQVLHMIEGDDIALVHRFDQTHIIRNPLVARLEALYARAGAPDESAAA